MADITIRNGVYKPTYNWGASSCIGENGLNRIDQVKMFVGNRARSTPSERHMGRGERRSFEQ